MYSIVMMTALATTPDAPQFNGYFRDLFSRSNSNNCAGCNGCAGAMRYSCSGGCAGVAASPASCSGCGGCNGGVFGLGERVRGWFTRDTSGYGCCGGRSYSCMGASFACSGFAHSCFGAPTSYTPVFNGGLSCQGGLPMTAPAPMFDPMFNPMPIPGMPGVPGGPFAVPDPAPGNVGLRPAAHTNPGGALTSGGSTARASVIVKLPADARLFVDARALTLTGAERKFVSPELPTDQEFVYRFRAEYERNGETVSVTKKVPVRAGATVTVEFADLTAARPAEKPATPAAAPGKEKEVPAKPTARETVKPEPPVAPAAPAPATPSADRATITVMLPPGATLYVDDRKSPSQEPTRSLTTPPLPAGREFAYLLKAEIVRNGHPETLTQKVPFRAGERITVDFTTLGK